MFGLDTGLPQSTNDDLALLSSDTLEQRLAIAQETIGRIRAEQLRTIAEVDRRQTHTADGCRTMAEWVASRLDESPETAHTLVRTSRSIPGDVNAALAAGIIGFARATEMARLAAAGVSDPLADGWAHDIVGLRHQVTRYRRITSADQHTTTAGRFLNIQPTLDDTAWSMWGQFPAIDGAVIENAINNRIDSLPHHSDVETTTSQRRADALTSICVGAQPNTGGNASSAISVFVDADRAAPTSGEAGIKLVAGPQLGLRALDAVLCDATIDVYARGEFATVRTGGSRTIQTPPDVLSPISTEAAASSTDATAATGPSSTTSSPGPSHRITPKPTSPPSAGGTTTSASTAEASN